MASTTDVRRMHVGHGPVGRHVESIVLAFATNATTIEADTYINGTIVHAYLTAPALDGSQYTFSMENEDDTEIYTSGLLDESATTNLDPGVSVTGTTTLKIVTASSQTANRTFSAVLMYV